LAGPGGVIVLFRADIPPLPAGWERLGGGLGHQMLVEDLVDPGTSADVELRPLGEADAEAMVELVRLTQPGPFERRTFELGGYVGVFAEPGPGEDRPRLIAIAGERIRFPGHTEISAVCTHPDARGRGLAATLTHHIAQRVQARSEVPFLHVAEHNDNARRVYERLGFRTRRMVEALVARAPGRTSER
jgi:predicted GNAT family acetyltransferase